MLPFHIVDVFAEQKYQGNQLAVFQNAGDLSAEQMLSIARETNFQETTFIVSENLGDNSFDVRIFTPEYEVPFAGHPTLGTANILMQIIENEEVILNLKIGKVPVKRENNILWLEVSNPQFLNIFDKNSIANLFGFTAEEINLDTPLQVISTGLPYLLIPLKTKKTIENLSFDTEKIKKWLIENKLYKDNSNDGLTTSFFFFTTEVINLENDFHARMFCLENGIMREDSATGSANSCLLAYLLKYESKNIVCKVEQGYEMNRPSLIELKGQLLDNQVFKLQIGGKVQMIATGTWHI